MQNPETTPATEPETTAPDYIGTATYDPADNKIRITAFSRLPRPLYDRVRAAGFIWAPKQELFVAPMWTPDREDLAIELCGELGDEDSSMVDRAEERAERFDGYSERRAGDADRARAGVAAIADHIPLGQPILVGHHSERRARKDAERIENGMRKAVKMWETSKYWTDRAAGALAHAKYKEEPDVRARRIKGIGADKRKRERQLGDAVEAHTFWARPDLTVETARQFAGRGGGDGFTMPRKEGDRPDFAQRCSPWEALTGNYPNLYAARTLQEVIDRALAVYPGRIEYLTRWIGHYDNRLAYETAMLAEQGAIALIAPRPRPIQLPLLNYRQTEIVARRWSKVQTFRQVEMTSAEYMGINKDQRGTLDVEGAHRARFCLYQREDGKVCRFPRHDSTWCAVFLTDSKVHAKPAKDEPAPVQAGLPAAEDTVCPDGPTCPDPVCREERTKRGIELPPAAPVVDKGAEFEAMRKTLKAGIKIVSAPQLFPTPHELATRMVTLADIGRDHRVLEPSFGTGVLVNAIRNALPGVPGEGPHVVCVEINGALADRLREREQEVICADFLQCNGDLGTFDRVVMNPPFANGSDILHVRHALNKLRPGGKLVAIVAGGPRQKACLEPLADYWEELPDGTFATQGTGVRTILLVIEKRE